MTLIGYARVSSKDQDCSLQEAALRDYGCTVIRSEKRSGVTREGRTELETVLAFIREGDTLVVTRLDRLARSVADLYNILRSIDDAGAHFKAIQQGGLDTTSSTGKLMMGMLGVVAEFERDMIHERQAEGIAQAKLRGVYKGRKPTVPADEVIRLKQAGVRPADIARQLKIGRTSVYRALDRQAASPSPSLAG